MYIFPVNLRLTDIDLSWAALWGFFFPKAFFDMFTPYIFPLQPDWLNRIFNFLVAPIPIVQIFNLLAGIFVLSIEWPLPFLKDTPLHKAFVHRFVVYPIFALMALLQYQATNAAFYLLIGTAYAILNADDWWCRVYMQAWFEREIIGTTGNPQKRGIGRV